MSDPVAPPPPPPPPPYGQGQYGHGHYWAGQYGAPARNGIGVAALVLGIVALVLSFTVFFGFVCGVLAVVFGLVGRARARRGEATNGGVAFAGLVMGVLGIVIALALVLVLAGGSAGHVCVHVGTDPNPCVTGG